MSALAALVEGNRIFTADQVDTAAIIADSASATPTYPERLLHEGLAGQVIAEFVVDTLGRVEHETLGVVSSSHREFSDAVMVPNSTRLLPKKTWTIWRVM